VRSTNLLRYLLTLVMMNELMNGRVCVFSVAGRPRQRRGHHHVLASSTSSSAASAAAAGGAAGGAGDAVSRCSTGSVSPPPPSDALRHSPSRYVRPSVRPSVRFPTGQGKLEKVREFEWSGKGQGKIFFWKIGEVKENQKLVPRDVRFSG